jgi:mono/diheme cytochrome c family protein
MMNRVLVTSAALVMGGLLVSVAASNVYAQDAKGLYEKNCVACHGAGGKGDGPAGKMLKPPPEDFAAALKGKSDADITKIIKEGGKAVGKAATMPAYSAKMSDDQIKGVVDYIKGLGK